MTEQLKLRLEREDKEDGSITYHLWTAAGEWIVGLNDDEDKQGGKARSYANAIVHAVNCHDELTGALRFILAFYEPGQTYLDTDAWKVAEAGARAAMAKAEAS